MSGLNAKAVNGGRIKGSAFSEVVKTKLAASFVIRKETCVHASERLGQNNRPEVFEFENLRLLSHQKQV